MDTNFFRMINDEEDFTPEVEAACRRCYEDVVKYFEWWTALTKDRSRAATIAVYMAQFPLEDGSHVDFGSNPDSPAFEILIEKVRDWVADDAQA